jgi:hypothetical protein
MVELSRTDAGRAILDACHLAPAKPDDGAPAGAAGKPAPGPDEDKRREICGTST